MPPYWLRGKSILGTTYIIVARDGKSSKEGNQAEIKVWD